jgi:hypothetical protein
MMTTKRIVLLNTDGSIGIVTPAPNARLVSRVGTETFDPPVPAYHFFRETAYLYEAAAQNYVEYAETEEKFVARIQAKDVPAGAIVAGVHDVSELPQDRTFRNAWTHDGKKPVVHMDRARAIHRDMLRRARAPKLAALDIEYQKADEAGNAEAKQRVSAGKKLLRDATADPKIDAAITPDELKSLWPKDW